MNNINYKKYFAIISIVVLLIVIYFLFQNYINQFVKDLNGLIKQSFMLGAIILFGFSLLDTTIGIIGPSGSALLVASLYYPSQYFWLALISYGGVFVGCTSMYLISRFITSKNHKHKKTGKIWNLYEKNAEISVVIFSATAACNVVSVFSGMVAMNYWRFILMTFIGRFVITYYLVTNILRLSTNFIKNPNWQLGLIIVTYSVILAIIVILIYIWTRKVHKNESNN